MLTSFFYCITPNARVIYNIIAIIIIVIIIILFVRQQAFVEAGHKVRAVCGDGFTGSGSWPADVTVETTRAEELWLIVGVCECFWFVRDNNGACQRWMYRKSFCSDMIRLQRERRNKPNIKRAHLFAIYNPLVGNWYDANRNEDIIDGGSFHHDNDMFSTFTQI